MTSMLFFRILLNGVPGFFAMADMAFALPTRTDGTDKLCDHSLLECITNGKAVVALARPEIEVGRIIRQCGVLMTPEDLSALTNAILKLTNSSHERQQLG